MQQKYKHMHGSNAAVRGRAGGKEGKGLGFSCVESIWFLSRENRETKGESKRERASMRVDESGWKKGGLEAK